MKHSTNSKVGLAYVPIKHIAFWDGLQSRAFVAMLRQATKNCRNFLTPKDRAMEDVREILS